MLATTSGAALTGAMLAGGLAVGAPSSAQRGMPERSLGSVSCVGKSFCLGVGPYGIQIEAGPTFSQIWNGTTWRTVAVPPSSESFGLLGVSCTSTSNCIAVGGGRFNAGNQVSEAWNGSSWRTLRAPAVPGHSELNGVDCTSAGHCIAVGTGNAKNARALAQIWNGSSWSLTSPVVPTGAIGSSFEAVGCSGPSNCLAVGSYTPSKGQFVDTPLAESWNGHSWTLLPAPAGLSDIDGVACPTASLCLAVGGGSQGEFSIASAKWNGTTWTTLTTPSPAIGMMTQHLTAISCPSATSCIASGSGPTPIDDGNGVGPFAEKWTGGSGWTLLSVPSPKPIDFGPEAAPDGGAYGLAGISCVSSVQCMATGGQGETEAMQALASFAVQWNGQHWTVLRTGNIDGLFGVSCAPGPRCVTTGTYLDKNDTTQTLAESVAGSAVRLVSPHGLGGVLSAISCPSATFCLASRGASAASWNGKRWTWTGAVAKDPVGDIGLLSCVSPDFCMALGASGGKADQVWNGKSWRVPPLLALPKGKQVDIGIDSLSCATARSCLAVGSWLTEEGEGAGGTLAELWNGSTWRVLGSPGHRQASENFDAVSCFASTGCMAIGTTDVEHQTLFAARWNGQRWKVTKLPGTYSVIWGGLAAGPTLSCPTATSCVAAGSNAVGPVHQPLNLADLGLIWNGRTWRIDNPGGPGGVSTVSCSSPTLCVAIGRPGTATLAKLWNGRTWKVIHTVNP
jgi:hypothetical protein